MLRAAERLIEPTRPQPGAPPHAGFWRFYGHYLRQARAVIGGVFVTSLVLTLCDVAIPVFIGHVVQIVSSIEPAMLWERARWQLAGMAVFVLAVRPAVQLLYSMLLNQALAPGFSNLVRWQSHWHVVRQSWTFFQNDFAGRIANRVMQTGPALRESVTAAADAVLYIGVYGAVAIGVLAVSDWRLGVPMGAWFVAYLLVMRWFVPRCRARSRAVSEARSILTGRVVDSYTNILTVKLFARATDEDAFVRDAIDDHTDDFRAQQRMITRLGFTLSLLNGALVAATGAVAMTLYASDLISVGAVATALPLTWQLTGIAGYAARNITAIFENAGLVQDGMRSIDVPLQAADRPGAAPLRIVAGEIRVERLAFGYGTERGVLRGLDVVIAPGERIGLVGPSGAGKSTLVNLLLRFYEPETGRILIDGQDIAGVTQESLRTQIAMVTQDTSLLHRSIRDNIRYGRPAASDAEVIEAARRADAHEFITRLEDWQGRRGYDAHVGERGVKLSGGQRQRVAIARVVLKDAPVLILDEATSALDSEAEAAIQAGLDVLMQGRTVIAIAHRLSTIARMDRLIVLDRGTIAEAGTHADLIRTGGVYARLWERQSGGFAAETV